MLDYVVTNANSVRKVLERMVLSLKWYLVLETMVAWKDSKDVSKHEKVSIKRYKVNFQGSME